MTRLKLLEKGAALLLGITVFGAFPLFAKTMEIKIHSDLPIIEKENTNGADERIAIFNSRSDYQSKAKVWVAVQKKPIPRKEFILVEPPEAEWRHRNVWTVEDVLNEKGEVDRFAKRIVLKEQSDWGKEDNFSATVTYYQVREHPLPSNPDGTPSDNGPYFAGSDTKSLVVVAPEVSLESITFNHVPGNSDADGIDLRTEFLGEDIVGPEWTPSGTQPVAYRAGVRPIVKVNFNVRPALLNRVRAKATESGMSLSSGIAESWCDTKEGFLSGNAVISKQINKGDVSWKWSITGINGVSVNGWDEVQTTIVSSYKILGKPQTPWKEGTGEQRPWVPALDFVIDTLEAKFQSKEEKAIRVITGSLWENPRWWYGYDPMDGWAASRFVFHIKDAITQEETGNLRIYYDDFINTKDNPYDRNDNAVNCVDTAGLVGVSAALVGLETVIRKQMPWNEGNVFWDYHYFTVFERRVYDACKALASYIVSMDADEYGKNTANRKVEDLYAKEFN